MELELWTPLKHGKHFPSALHHSSPHYQIIPDFIRTCPGLQSLTLNLGDCKELQCTWSLDKLLEPLGSVTFPVLHTFRAIGGTQVDWESFFESPNSSPLRTFLLRHPQLSTIGIGSINDHGYDQTVSPEDMSKLLPSLRHLEAPVFLCGPILRSSLGNKIESVEIFDRLQSSSLGEAESNVNAVMLEVSPLPELRRLILSLETCDSIREVTVKELLEAASNLEYLEFRDPLDKLVSVKPRYQV